MFLQLSQYQDHDLWVSSNVILASVMLLEESKFTQLSQEVHMIRGAFIALQCKTRYFLMPCAFVVFAVTGFFFFQRRGWFTEKLYKKQIKGERTP